MLLVQLTVHRWRNCISDLLNIVISRVVASNKQTMTKQTKQNKQKKTNKTKQTKKTNKTKQTNKQTNK